MDKINKERILEKVNLFPFSLAEGQCGVSMQLKNEK